MAAKLGNMIQPMEITPYINVGSLMDIPTGTFYQGKYGESILVGGLGFLDGIGGSGNFGKSTLNHYRNLTAMIRMGGESSYHIRDTEGNLQIKRIIDLTNQIIQYNFAKSPEEAEDQALRYYEEGYVTFSTKANGEPGEEWLKKYKEYVKAKLDEKSDYITLPFQNIKRSEYNQPIRWPRFSVGTIDSLSKFTISEEEELYDKIEMGDSKENTADMKAGKHRKRLIDEMLNQSQRCANYVSLVAHYDKVIQMDQYEVQHRRVAGEKDGIKFRAPVNFTYLTSNLIALTNSRVLKHDTDKTALYPTESNISVKNDTELKEIELIYYRAKNNDVNEKINIIFTGREGIMPSLSEYHYLKNNGYYGMVGNNTTHAVCLMPDYKIGRTTIRDKLKNNSKLRRAMNIMAEIRQIRSFMPYIITQYRLAAFIEEPTKIYETLKEKGYDWDMILEKTRGWWCPEGEYTDIYYLSSLDILRMCVDDYHPYWLAEDKVTIIPQVPKASKKK